MTLTLSRAFNLILQSPTEAQEKASKCTLSYTVFVKLLFPGQALT